MYYVYILQGKKYYCWYTNNLKRRLQEHIRGKTLTTKTLEAYKLIWYYAVENENDAKELERKIKNSGHIERRTKNNDFQKTEWA